MGELRGNVEVERELSTNARGTLEFTIRDCNGYRLRLRERMTLTRMDVVLQVAKSMPRSSTTLGRSVSS